MTPCFMNSMVPVLMTVVRTLPSCLIQIYGPDTWFNIKVLVAFPCLQVHTSSLHLSLYTYSLPPLNYFKCKFFICWLADLQSSGWKGRPFQVDSRSWLWLVRVGQWLLLQSLDQLQSVSVRFYHYWGNSWLTMVQLSWNGVKSWTESNH